jgi:two-component system KDP operon response regulator KdpE
LAAEQKKRVLVVEDEPVVQQMVRVLMTRLGLETIQAMDVSSAVQVLRNKPLPDLVLLDLGLPDIDGLELLRQMRGKEMFDDLPVIILSTLSEPDQIRAALDLGADRYVTKTTMAHNLVKTVQEVLRSGRRKPPSG